MQKQELYELVNKLKPDPLGKELIEMVAFSDSKDGKLECPWITWALKDNSDDNQVIDPKGILIMQDWGIEEEIPESLDKATNTIVSCIDANEYDRTITNLLKGDWKDKITTNNILVTNAVWGLRKRKMNDSSSGMCGYLGAYIHKRAFLTWGRLVRHISSQTHHDDFRLFVAGEWARFDNQENKSGEEIKVYLKRWRTWASKYTDMVDEKCFPDELGIEEIRKCKGRVFFLSHPCTWNSTYESKPFATFPPP